MVIAIFSDVHGNFDALEIALEQMESFSPDVYVCLGDIVGYGPEPVRCLERVAQIPNCIIIKGNHEKILLGELTTEACSDLGKISSEWTKANVSKLMIDYVRSFLEYHIIDDFGFYHSFSKEDADFPYLNSLEDILKYMPKDKCKIHFYGHTHRPRVTNISGEDFYVDIGIRQKLCKDKEYCINVGSIGQMRDSHTDYSFGVLFTDNNQCEVEIVRGNYDSFKTYCKIRDEMQNRKIADYLIREEERRRNYESAYNRR